MQIANIRAIHGEAIIKPDEMDAPMVMTDAPRMRDASAIFIFNPLKIAPRFVGLDVTITQS